MVRGVCHSGVGRMHSLSTPMDCRDKGQSASVRWVADRGERVGPNGGGVVLWVVGAGGTLKVDAHWVPRIIAAWRNFQNSVVVAARSNWGFRAH